MNFLAPLSAYCGRRYEKLGQKYHVETFEWVGWRGVFTFDPDGNTVELVAKDPGWIAPSSAVP